jgi:hypothetical protein
MSRQVKRSSRAAEDLYEIAVYLLKDGLPIRSDSSKRLKRVLGHWLKLR